MTMSRTWILFTGALIILGAGGSCTNYYVGSDSCAGYSFCATLQHYASNQSKYFIINTRFIFLPGNHTLSDSISINNVKNVTFTSNTNGTANIRCNSYGGIVFQNSINIYLSNLSFICCGQPLPDTLQRDGETAQAALAFGEVTDLLIESVSVSHSAGYGILGHCVHGNFTITQSTFSFNKGGGEYLGGNAAIEYTNCSDHGVDSTLCITFSNFTYGDYDRYQYTNYSGTLATGLSLILSHMNTTVRVSNVLMEGNKNNLTYKGFGGNMFVHFFNRTAFTANSVTISKSKFSKGVAWLGAGIGTTFYAGPNVTTTTTDCTDILHLQDVEISDNTGIIGSGYYFQFQMRQPQPTCPYTIVNVNNVTFNNNSIKIPVSDQAYFIGNGIAVQIVVKYHKNLNAQRISNHYRVRFENCSFRNSWVDKISQDDDFTRLALPSIITFIILNSNNQIEIKNCEFLDNQFSGIGLLNSMITFSGNITIRNNTGLNGGGMMLCESSFINLSHNTTIHFINNSAKHKGGGIYTEENCFHTKPFCFYQLANQEELNCSDYFTTVNIIMINNTARYAGDHIYGGALDYCKINDCTSKDMFNQLFTIKNNSTTSAVTSSPIKIRFCHKEYPNTSLHYPDEVYPGESVWVYVAILGQLDGTVPGTILEYSAPNTEPIAHSVGNTCQKIEIKVQGGNNRDQVHKTLRLSTDSDISKEGDNFTYISVSKPLHITITIKPCPPGFSLNDSYLCDCNRELQDHDVKCDITRQVIERISPSWIGYNNESDSVKSMGIIYYQICPYDYCNDKSIWIHVSQERTNQDLQCAPNRTGLLCSECSEGLSLSIGTSDCLECTTNVGLALAIVGYAIIGVLLVFLLITFDITNTDGTFSGLLFYAHIIKLNEYIFMPSGNNNILSMTISMMSLHLGLKSCIFNGMDAYSKAWMGFCFPTYLFLLIIGLIVLCQTSSRAANLLGGNIIRVLATLIQLVYTNLIVTIVRVLSFTKIQFPSQDDSYKAVLVWLYDPNLGYFQGKHIPLALLAVALSLLILAYTLVLLFVQPLQRYSHLRCFTWVAKLKPLIDAYTAPHVIKDNCRYWEGLLLLSRLALAVYIAANTKGSIEHNLDAISFICILLITIVWAVGGIYKNIYLNALNFLSIVNLGTTSLILAGSKNTKFLYQRKQLPTKLLFQITVYISFTIATITLITVLIFHIYKRIRFWRIKYRRSQYQPLLANGTENLPAVCQFPGESE